jgi:hypothetical protein
MGKLVNRNNLTKGDKVSFSYHEQQRQGTVEEVVTQGSSVNPYFTVKHDGYNQHAPTDAERIASDGTEREYSNFNFSKVDGRDYVSTGIEIL